MSAVRVFTPVGRPHRDAAGDWNRSALTGVRGGVVGIVDNTKPNARAVMTGVAERLLQAGLIGKTNVKRKGSPSEGVSDASFGEIEQEAAVVLVGSAD
jgi:hypothetical protein